MSSKVNLDVADRLDITCRQGDTFELILTLKDSAGTALALATDSYSFLMQVRSNAVFRSRTARVKNASEGIVIGSVGAGDAGPVNFEFKDIDDSGNVTISLSASDMRKVDPGKYKYDFQYIKPRTSGDLHKTLLRGNFTVNSDISKSA